MFDKNKFNNSAMIILDVQHEFCNPAYRGTPQTDIVARRIARLAPEFRRQGATLYVVTTRPFIYISSEFQKELYALKPVYGDILLDKSMDNAVTSSNLLSNIQTEQKNNALLCGFNLSACIYETALDLKAYNINVTLLRDLCGNDRLNLTEGVKGDGAAQWVRKLKNEGIELTTSTKILQPT